MERMECEVSLPRTMFLGSLRNEVNHGIYARSQHGMNGSGPCAG